MNSKQQKLFDSVLVQVVRDGWTQLALRDGAQAAGFSEVEARKLFPRGIPDIVAAFHEGIDEAMRVAIKGNRKFAMLRVRDKVAFAIRMRLVAIEPHREVMRRLLVWGMLPKNIRAATKLVWQAADAIWIEAGDTSTDTSFYTKRILLVAVMKSTLSFWLNDMSPNCSETWEFLERRIADVMKLGKGISVIKTVGLSDIASFIRSKFAA